MGTNVNFRTRNPTGAHVTPGDKPLMPRAEFDASRANNKPAEPKPGRLSKKQLKRILHHLPHIRRCQKKQHRPHSVPRVVLEQIIAYKLY